MIGVELDPRKISNKALYIREKFFNNGGIPMYQFSFTEKESENMKEKVLNLDSSEETENKDIDKLKNIKNITKD